jgi:DNA-binding Xre family transcriptional regulator
MTTMPLRWKLENIMKKHNLSAYRIAKQAEVGLTTIYRIKNNRSDTVQGEVLDSILQAVYELTGVKYGVGDLLEWQPIKKGGSRHG